MSAGTFYQSIDDAPEHLVDELGCHHCGTAISIVITDVGEPPVATPRFVPFAESAGRVWCEPCSVVQT